MRTLFALLFSCILCFGQNAQKQIMLADTDAPLTPTDSPGGGSYGSTQSVTLSDPTSALILYTINGSTPACPGTGTLYTGAISVAVTTTIKAIGCNGGTGGGVLTSVYTISGGSAPTISQTCGPGGSFSSPLDCVFGSNLGTGDYVVGYAMTGGSTVITDNIGCSSLALTTDTAVSNGVQFTTAAAAGSQACTIRVAGTTPVSIVAVVVHGSSGIDARSAVASQGAFGSGSTFNCPAITTVASNDLVICGALDAGISSGTYTQEATYTLNKQATFGIGIESKAIASPTSGLVSTWTYNAFATQITGAIAAKP